MDIYELHEKLIKKRVHGFIAGSYALKTLLNLDWEPNDIDYYINCANETEFFRKQVKLFEALDSRFCAWDYKHKYYGNTNFQILGTYNEIQFIAYEDRELLYTNFDLNICKVAAAINGDTMTYRIAPSAARDIKNRTLTFKPGVSRTNERVIKYSERFPGFTKVFLKPTE